MQTLDIRPSGIGPLDDMPWGSHLCSFYDTSADLLNLLVPYFVAGLEANEKCYWITSVPVTAEDAIEAMRTVVPGFDAVLADGRMVVLPHDEWYLKDGVFDMDRVLAAWAEAVDNALEEGFDGLRVTGNTAWLESSDWAAFAEYERTIDTAIVGVPILVL